MNLDDEIDGLRKRLTYHKGCVAELELALSDALERRIERGMTTLAPSHVQRVVSNAQLGTKK